MKRFNIVVQKEDGGVELYAMKEWLRQHPQHVPSGLDATSSTLHQLRIGNKWLFREFFPSRCPTLKKGIPIIRFSVAVP